MFCSFAIFTTHHLNADAKCDDVQVMVFSEEFNKTFALSSAITKFVVFNNSISQAILV